MALKQLVSTFLAALSILLCLVPAWATVDGFWVWQPDPKGVRYVIPKVLGMTPQEFAARYQKSLRSSSVYSRMEDAEHVNLSTARNTFRELPQSTSEHPNVAVVLNRPKQMTDRSSYLRTVVSSFEQEGPNLFAIPVGLETVLSRNEMNQWRGQLNTLDGMLGVGGDDPHPRTYGQTDTSRTLGNINVARDRQQTAYLTQYRENGKGRVFCICGSMQRIAIEDGHGFHDDIAHITPIPQGPERPEDGPALREVIVDPKSEVAIAAGATRFQTSNAHHAAVNASETREGSVPISRITGFNVEADGKPGHVVKAIDFANNAGFATQFHPEFRGSPEEVRMLKYMTTGWKMRGRPAPEAVIKCLEDRLKGLLPN